MSIKLLRYNDSMDSLQKPSSQNLPVPEIIQQDLQTISVRHYDFSGNIKNGNIIIHKIIADDIADRLASNQSSMPCKAEFTIGLSQSGD